MKKHIIILLLIDLSKLSEQGTLIDVCIDEPCGENKICSERYCHCQVGFSSLPGTVECIPNAAYGEYCNSTIHCSYLGGLCVGNKCSCENEKTYVGGICHQQVPLNSTCNNDIDCAFGGDRASVECKNQKCSCAKGYDHHATHGCIRNETINNEHELSDSENKAPTNDTLHITNKFGPNYGDPCSEKINFSHPYLVCKNFVVDCKPGYYAKHGECHAEIGEKTIHVKFCPEGSELVRNKCLCPKTTVNAPNMRSCVNRSTSLNDPCEYDVQCILFDNAYCSKTCKCHAYATYNKEKELCELKEGLGGYCELDSMCLIPNTRCNEHKSCVCKENYLERDGKCMPGIGASCEDPDEICAVENSECVSIKKGISKYFIDYSKGQKYCQCKEKYGEGNGKHTKTKQGQNDSTTSIWKPWMTWAVIIIAFILVGALIFCFYQKFIMNCIENIIGLFRSNQNHTSQVRQLTPNTTAPLLSQLT